MYALSRRCLPLPARNILDSAYIRFGNSAFVGPAPIRTPGNTIGLKGCDPVCNLLLKGLMVPPSMGSSAARSQTRFFISGNAGIGFRVSSLGHSHHRGRPRDVRDVAGPALANTSWLFVEWHEVRQYA
jgi:hypothetical protein